MIKLTAEQEAYLRAAWVDKATRRPDIAEALNCCADTVTALAKSLGLGPKPDRNLKWPDERVEEMKVLLREGLTYSQIGKKLKVSRNAISGMVFRLGLAFTREKVAKPRPAPRPKATTAKRPKPRKQRPNNLVAVNAQRRARPELIIVGCGGVIEKEQAPPPRVVPKADAFKPLPGSEPKPWTERAFGECAWVVGGEGADALSCCQPIFKGSWCRAHHKLGHQHPADAKRWDDRLGISKARRAA